MLVEDFLFFEAAEGGDLEQLAAVLGGEVLEEGELGEEAEQVLGSFFGVGAYFVGVLFGEVGESDAAVVFAVDLVVSGPVRWRGGRVGPVPGGYSGGRKFRFR